MCAREVTALIAVPHIVVDQVARAIAIQESGWAIFAACAAAAAALGTFTLAYFTWQSLKRTDAAMAIEDTRQRTNTTVPLIKEYTQTRVPVTDTIALTPQAASSQIILFSKNLPELKALKTEYDSTSSGPQHEQYRVIMSSIPIVINWYMQVMQLLRADVLNVPFFMNQFAKTFLAVFEPLSIVNAETNTVPASSIARLISFKEMCETWLKRADATESEKGAD
jgi:hypothetical protein